MIQRTLSLRPSNPRPLGWQALQQGERQDGLDPRRGRRGAEGAGKGRCGGGAAAGAPAEPEATGAERELGRTPPGPQCLHRRLRATQRSFLPGAAIKAVAGPWPAGGQPAPWPRQNRCGRACVAWYAASTATASTCTARRAAAGSSSGAWSPAPQLRRPRCAPETAWSRSTASTWRVRRITRWVPAPGPGLPDLLPGSTTLPCARGGANDHPVRALPAPRPQLPSGVQEGLALGPPCPLPGK